MRKKFDVTGYFYSKKSYHFRKYLHIKRKSAAPGKPDLMVVMMNPGSSRPEDGFEDQTETEVPTVPDNTQSQIMRVMESLDLDFARILNLSDFRESKSNVLFKKMEVLEEKNIPHSIFDPSRKNELQKLFTPDVPVILAWGVSKKLKELAEMALNRIDENCNAVGWQKESVDYAYYHPLPQNYHKQQEWLEVITKHLKPYI